MTVQLIEVQDNMQSLRVPLEHLPELLREQGGWHSAQRLEMFAVQPGGELRQLDLADVTTDADDQFRYYAGQLRYADTGEALTPPVEWSVRWVQ